MTDEGKQRVKLLIVEDEDDVRTQLRWALSDEFDVVDVATRADAIRQLGEARPDVVICDLHLPPNLGDISEGLAIIDAARQERPPVSVVVITGSESKRVALEAARHGACGYFQKPFDPEEISHIVSQAAYLRRLEQENRKLRDELVARAGFSALVGKSEALTRTIRLARTVAATDATVLLTGESGTGKEVLARAIHDESPRASGPFIAVSCAALPSSLIESELFGFEKGAFTGAFQSKKGRFELAHGGTLFLDEISTLEPAVQVKLLRVLQEHSFERLGGVKTVEVDIRLIVATNVDLEKETEEGRFRRDLFYRLNVIPLALPPLRDRIADVPALAKFFAEKAARQHGREIPELEPKLVSILHEHDWPGNVRELENLMERLVILSQGPLLGLEFLPPRMLGLSSELTADETTFEGAVVALKRRLIEDALKAEGGNRVAAARRLGISRSYLHRLITDFKLNHTDG